MLNCLETLTKLKISETGKEAPVKPIKEIRGEKTKYTILYCPRCGVNLYKPHGNYCKNCGQRLDVE